MEGEVANQDNGDLHWFSKFEPSVQSMHFTYLGYEMGQLDIHFKTTKLRVKFCIVVDGSDDDFALRSQKNWDNMKQFGSFNGRGNRGKEM